MPGGFEVADVQRPFRPHILEQVRGPGAPSQTVLRADRFVIGRAPECDIPVDSGGVSRQHLLITRAGPEYRCEDCGSTNGVYLNGIRIHTAVLREGDRIQISDIVFIYHEGA
jgi:pSer/pThr/pTyr-binding forkhead associated (FHA) protein